MPTNTYVALRKETVAVATGTVTFDLTGISGYTDLRIVASVKGNVGTPTDYTTLLQFNGDTASNYSRTLLRGTGTAQESARSSSASFMALQTSGYLSTTGFQNILIDVLDYSNSTTFKTTLIRADQADIVTTASVGLWRKTPEAISSIRIFLESGNFGVGSTFSLYGIKAYATESTPKASGGYIYADSTYYYHSFLSSGTFTPSQALTVDYLVVAGGGGGSTNEAGGGGAGGLRSTVTSTGGLGTLESALSLSSATNYTVTVGGGGAAAGTVGTQGSNSVFATITSTGGGGGGNGGAVGGPGGSSGGGGANGSNAAGTRTASPVQGFSGGAGSPANGGAGGGGGAGAVGVAGTASTAGNGGAGLELAAFATATGTGVNKFYAGGGGGGAFTGSTQSRGGFGGGGAGGAGTPTVGTAAIANTGGGGGGAGTGGGIVGAAGGSGLVIVRYLKA
jgi:hypothetical protein